jgi:hypothetical protein
MQLSLCVHARVGLWVTRRYDHELAEQMANAEKAEMVDEDAARHVQAWPQFMAL